MQWAVFLLDQVTAADLNAHGLKPRTLEGLLGLITYPMLHANWNHLIDNSVTAFVLLFGMFSFYGRIGWQVLLWSWFMSGLWIWIAARAGNHIGFSGVIYALAAFIFFSGVFRKYFRLMALSGVVVFLYGSMVWGILPIKPQVSWEGHLFGAIAGLILAYYFKEKGPQRPKYSWELEEEQEEELPQDEQYWMEPQKKRPPSDEKDRVQLRYVFKPRKKDATD